MGAQGQVAFALGVGADIKYQMPNPRLLNRKLHRWGAVISALPFLVVIVSGLFLQVKKQVQWVQPPEIKTDHKVPEVSLDRILEAARSVPEAKITDWAQVDRLELRPKKGFVRVSSTSRWEVQVDIGTGEVLTSGPRRTDWLTEIHEGEIPWKPAKLWIFLPSALIALGLWVTGIYLFLLPYLPPSRRREEL